jgi:hypothetical protein
MELDLVFESQFRFLTSKKCVWMETEKFKNWKNWTQTPHLKNLQIFFIILKPLPEVLSHNGITAQQWSWLVEYFFQFGEVSGLPIIQKRTICQRKKNCFFFFSGICYTLMKGKNIWFEYDNFKFLFPWNMANLGKFFAKNSCVQVTTPFLLSSSGQILPQGKPWSFNFQDLS